MTTASEKKLVLAVGAHPDDVEFCCAGTLKLLGQRGHQIHVATLSLGDCGSKDLPAEAVREKRRQEAMRACELLGARFHYGGFSDFVIFNDDASNRRVTALLREVAPDIVLTHPPQDYLQDHEMTSRLVRNACFYASVPNYDTRLYSQAPATSAIPFLYYWDTIEGTDVLGRPVAAQFCVDVSALIDFKTEMLACHASQREWLRAQHGMDEYLETMRRWALRRGEEAATMASRSITHAEAFRQHRGHPYPTRNILETLLADYVIANPSYLSAID